jgi:hypothetical protein
MIQGNNKKNMFINWDECSDSKNYTFKIKNIVLFVCSTFLLLFSLCGVAQDLKDNQNKKVFFQEPTPEENRISRSCWIWYPEKAHDAINQTRYFRKTFKI